MGTTRRPERQPNTLLQRARLNQRSPSGSGRPMSRQELADSVNAYLYQTSGRQSSIDAHYIGKLERGDHRWPNDDYREAFRHVLFASSDAELGFYVIRGLNSASTIVPGDSVSDGPGETSNAAANGEVRWLRSASPAQGADMVVLGLQLDGREVAVPLSRRLLLQAGIGSFVETFAFGSHHDTIHDRVQRADLTERLTITSPAHFQEVVTHLREQWHALVRTDNLLGPRFALGGVLNQIAVVEALCSVLGSGQRREMVGIGAQYAESAAWLYEDVGNMAQARSWTNQAMEWAYEGDDERMVAWTIFRRAQQAAATPHTAQAVGLAQAARRHEDGLARPTRAAIRVQEAYGHALDGEENAAQQLLDDAHIWAASDIIGDAHEGHGSYCTPSYIELQRANCWLAISKPKKAISLYERCLGKLPVVYQRNRAAGLSRLAVAYVADGQLDQAASTAHAALPVARSTGSTRILAEIKSVGAKLVYHRSVHGVADLLDDLEVNDH